MWGHVGRLHHLLLLSLQPPSRSPWPYFGGRAAGRSSLTRLPPTPELRGRHLSWAASAPFNNNILNTRGSSLPDVSGPPHHQLGHPRQCSSRIHMNTSKSKSIESLFQELEATVFGETRSTSTKPCPFTVQSYVS